MHVRLMLAVVVAVCGLVVVPGTARSVPGICPPFCDSIPDAAWIESSSLPLYLVYRWPGLAALAVDAPAPRFGFEGWCASPTVADDPRDYVVAARAEVSNPDGQWNLRVQVLHWRGPVTAGGPIALETLEKARMALALCHLTAPAVSPSITSSDAERLATVISDGGRRVMHAYLVADPRNGSLVEVALWSTLPSAVEWSAVPDTQVFDAMAAPLCAAYLGSCR